MDTAQREITIGGILIFLPLQTRCSRAARTRSSACPGGHRAHVRRGYGALLYDESAAWGRSERECAGQ